MLEINAATLVSRSSLEKLTFPSPACTIPFESTRYSSLPPLDSLIALATSLVTVPLLGLGISPLGPNTRAYLLNLAIREGVVIRISKSIFPLSN